MGHLAAPWWVGLAGPSEPDPESQAQPGDRASCGRGVCARFPGATQVTLEATANHCVHFQFFALLVLCVTFIKCLLNEIIWSKIILE